MCNFEDALTILLSHYDWVEVLEQCHAHRITLATACSKVCIFLQNSNIDAFDIGKIYDVMCGLWSDTKQTTREIPKALFENCQNNDHQIACARICKELMDTECDMNAKIDSQN